MSVLRINRTRRTGYRPRRDNFDSGGDVGAREKPKPVPSNILKRPVNLPPMKRIKK